MGVWCVCVGGCYRVPNQYSTVLQCNAWNSLQYSMDFLRPGKYRKCVLDWATAGPRLITHSSSLPVAPNTWTIESHSF